ncbi:MAG: hypothetical protein V3T83_05960, partial [Acidobacteriota bacterium]
SFNLARRLSLRAGRHGPQDGRGRLFSRSDQYLGTEVLDSGQCWHLTVDRWTSRQAHKFLAAALQEESGELIG